MFLILIMIYPFCHFSARFPFQERMSLAHLEHMYSVTDFLAKYFYDYNFILVIFDSGQT